MPEFKGTPGPWEHLKDCEPDPSLVMIDDSDGFDNEICVVHGEHRAANARLIAAAPELLEALECAVSAWCPNGKAESNLWERCMSVIAKATGN